MCSISAALIGTATMLELGTNVADQNQKNALLKQKNEYEKAQIRTQQLLAQKMVRDIHKQTQEKNNKAYKENTALIGQQRALFAANGIDINSGSALNIQKSIQHQNKLRALEEQERAQKKAQEYERRAQELEHKSLYQMYSMPVTESRPFQGKFLSTLQRANSFRKKLDLF